MKTIITIYWKKIYKSLKNKKIYNHHYKINNICNKHTINIQITFYIKYTPMSNII